jgi:hypothetical protein
MAFTGIIIQAAIDRITIQKAVIDTGTGRIAQDEEENLISSSITASKKDCQITSKGIDFEGTFTTAGSIVVSVGREYLEIDNQKLSDGDVFFNADGNNLASPYDVWAWVRDNF